MSYSVPEHVYEHVELIQPTTMFSRLRKQKTTFRWSTPHNESTLPDAPRIVLPNGIAVDASCNETVTISCLKELYNVGKFNASAKVGNKIGITGYLEQFANIADLQLFYADQRPDAVNSTFEFISINGNGTVLCSCVYILTLYERWSKLTEYLRGWGRSES